MSEGATRMAGMAATRNGFVHLHNHTEYSMLDGAAKIKPMVAEAVRLGQPALGITDHGYLFGAYEFYRECVSAGIKPIIGMEAYIHNQDEVLIVKNMVSEPPLIEKDKIIIPALEKLLVDMLIDTSLFSAQQNEKEFIMRSVMEKYTLNELKMRRYAVRRNREEEIDELINISLAK